MVEQIQPTPPYDVLTTINIATSDAAKATPTTSHSSTYSAASTSSKGDTVTLSESAQANQLYQQGNSVSQIAALLGLPQAAIDTDLNLNADDSVTAVQKSQTGGTTQATQTAPVNQASPFGAASSPVTAATLSTANVS